VLRPAAIPDSPIAVSLIFVVVFAWFDTLNLFIAALFEISLIPLLCLSLHRLLLLVSPLINFVCCHVLCTPLSLVLIATWHKPRTSLVIWFLFFERFFDDLVYMERYGWLIVCWISVFCRYFVCFKYSLYQFKCTG